MRVTIALARLKGAYRPGDPVVGSVHVESSSDQNSSAINLNFVGRIAVEIRSRNPTLNTINTAQHNFFRITKCLWEGTHRPPGIRKHPFEIAFPDDPLLLPSYSDSESPYLSGVIGKGKVEYFLEVQVLSSNMSMQTSARQVLNFEPHRYAERPLAVPSKVPMGFVCQTPLLTDPLRRNTIKDRFKSSTNTKAPSVHFLLKFVHATEAILGQTLHLFVDLIPDPERTTALTVPPVYLRSLKIVLVADHILSTSYASDEQNGVPARWTWKRTQEIMRFKAAVDATKILLYDKCDLRPHFRDLKIPSNIIPTIEHDNLKLLYHFEISAEFECLKKMFKHDDNICDTIKLLPSELSPALLGERQLPASGDGENTWGSFTEEDRCPVCQMQLPLGPETLRQAHLDECLTAATSVNIPLQPKSVLVVDDYSDFTSPIAVAYMAHLRAKQELFARCVGRAVWAEHDHFDVLELPASDEALQSLLSKQGISWSRTPVHRYWEREELNSYDYVLYFGQHAQAAQLMLDNMPPALNQTHASYKRATLINMANFTPREKWAHDTRDMETAWTAEVNPDLRLQRQFEVIKDCIYEFSWQIFSLALPGFSKQAHPDRFEIAGVVPSELPVPAVLPPELSAVREVQELPGSQVSSIRRRSVNSRYSQSSDRTDDGLYADPRHEVAREVNDMHLRPTDNKHQHSYKAVPSNVYEMP